MLRSTSWPLLHGNPLCGLNAPINTVERRLHLEFSAAFRNGLAESCIKSAG
jgi:hypothetical protein